mmetsp:Transcript_75367/g.201389  ORF Transcript_75367/g.201389 Transcript_75367/m.201389 type:complete len:212 (-) Transcript_75367:104-739(-)
MRQACFLHTDNFAVLTTFGESIDVGEGSDSGGDQPGKTKHRVDGDHSSNNNRVPIVSVSVSKLIARVIDQMPGDTIIQENKDKCQKSRNGGKKRDPGLSVDGTKVHNPGTASVRCNVGTVIGERRHAIGGAADLSRRDAIRDIEALHFNIVEESVGDQSPDQNGGNHGKIGNESTPRIIRKVGRKLDIPQEKGQPGCSQTENGAEKRCGHV